MPITPAAVMRGITVYVPNGNVPKQQAEVCGELLSSVGESVLIDDEGPWTLLQLYQWSSICISSYRSNG